VTLGAVPKGPVQIEVRADGVTKKDEPQPFALVVRVIVVRAASRGDAVVMRSGSARPDGSAPLATRLISLTRTTKANG